MSYYFRSVHATKKHKKAGDFMINFMNNNIAIRSIGFCGYVDEGLGRISHVNRGSNLLLLSLAKDKKIYELDDNNRLEVYCNDIMFLPKGSSYVCKTLPTGMFHMVEFSASIPFECAPFVFSPRDTIKMHTFFSSTSKIFKRKDTAFQMQLMSIVYDIIATMQIEYNQKYVSKNVKSILAPALDYIHSNYTKEQFNIGDLSAMCNISEDYLRKLFKISLNTSPRKYINKLKTDYAAELIHSGMHTVTDACFKAGFENTSYFSREFKKKFGVSPMEYKKSSHMAKPIEQE